MTSATEELRRMLDERGVEYSTDDGKTAKATRWQFGESGSAIFSEYDDGECVFVKSGCTWTPEQAVAATLGRGECHKVRVHMPIEDEMHCSECGRFLGFAGDVGAPPCNFCPNCGAKVVDAEVDE